MLTIRNSSCLTNVRLSVVSLVFAVCQCVASEGLAQETDSARTSALARGISKLIGSQGVQSAIPILLRSVCAPGGRGSRRSHCSCRLLLTAGECRRPDDRRPS